MNDNDQIFEVGETVVYHGIDGVDVLANLRGVTGRSAILFDEKAGTQGGVTLVRVDHTPLWYAVRDARKAGYDEVKLSETGWTPIAKWHEQYQQVVIEPVKFNPSIPAIVSGDPERRIQSVFRLRNSHTAYLAELFAEQMGIAPDDLRARLRAACYDVPDDVTRLSWLSALLDLIKVSDIPTDDSDAITTCLREVTALHSELARLLNEIREVSHAA